MIKDLLVVTDAIGDAAGPYALSLAQTFGAATTCVCVEPEGGSEDFALAEVRYDLVVSAREEALAVAREAAANFAYAAKTRDVAVETDTLRDSPGVVRNRLLDLARTHDLAIIEQSGTRREKPADVFLEDLLLGSGRPTIVVPKDWSPSARFDAVTVAWDGSAPAARAVADALPLLLRARRVNVVTVQTEAVAGVSERSHRLTTHLARHGIDAGYRATFSATSVVETVLGEVAQSGSDLLIMGAYGHSRLRELCLGGTSRDMLCRMTIPVMMSH
ncbi:universal stress protein [Methylobacterium sp. NEAU K]|uniref:universal stress protein n=1 Tax=Methylobacterium sp. NEAU K TaxID=3064946 RepID=UPI002734FE84|nr:universal stress protein [Methylobacterium sp. NEAU K]MDP4006623.1 universal stress protein [Methylobacterium sp. NEAU K]